MHCLLHHGDSKQLFKTFATNGRDNAKLREMSTDGVDHGGLLTNEQMPRAMKHQALLHRLGLDKPHVGSGPSLADRLGVSRRQSDRQPRQIPADYLSGVGSVTIDS